MKTLGALLLALATVSASAQVRETPVATGPLGPAERYQMNPLAATDGTDFFVVWGDSRGGTIGTRVTHDGRVLDPTGILLTSAGPRALLWCGDAYVLIYTAADNRSAGVVRFTRDGHIIDGPRNVTDSYVAAAATNGSTIVLVGTGITVLDDRAQVVEKVASPVTGAYAWAATSNGSTFELITALYSGGLNWVVAIALDAHGHPQKTLYFHGSSNQVLVTPAAAGYRGFYGDLEKDTVMTFETTSDPAPVSPLLGRVAAQAVTPTSSGYLLATKGDSGNEITVIRGSGETIVEPQPFTTTSSPTVPNTPAFAAAGDNVLLVWSEAFDTDSNVRAVVLDANGHAKTPAFDLAFSAPEQTLPSIATGAANDLVAWSEHSGLYYGRLTPDGVPLDGRGIQLAPSTYWLQVVRDGDAYVVAWLGDWVIHFRWIDAASGQPIGQTAGVSIQSPLSYFVARDDAGVVLFYMDGFGHANAQRIGMAGTIGPPVPLTPNDVYARGITGVWNGHEWLVVWNELTPVSSPIDWPQFSSKMNGERLTHSLSVIDSKPFEITSFPLGWATPVAATNGDNFLVAWSYNDSRFPYGVYARTVSATGTLGDPIQLVAAPNTEVKAAAWDGNRYAVAYTVLRDDAYTVRLMLTHAGANDELAISTAAPDQHEVSLAATPGRPLRAAYTHVATEPQFGYVSRVFTRDLVYARRRIAPH